MVWIVILLAGLAALVAVVVLVARIQRARPRPPAEAAGPGEGSRVVLDVDDADPDSPMVRRLVHDAAAHVLQARLELEEVEVVSRAGTVLGRVSRHAPPEKAVDLPPALLEPHAGEKHAPDVGRNLAADKHASPGVHMAADSREIPHRTLAEVFDLPEGVRSRLRNPDDTADIVRAMLDEAGVGHVDDGELIRVGDEVLIVLGERLGHPIGPDALNQAYMRFQQSGARRGVVVTPGLLFPDELRRRHAMAPSLLHAGPEGIQRMADAVAVGANPMRFVTGPALV